MVYMGVLSLVFLVCPLRTNIALVLIFFTLTATFSVLAGADWQLSQGNVSLALALQKVSSSLIPFILAATAGSVLDNLKCISADKR
jgi:hypothetical protein